MKTALEKKVIASVLMLFVAAIVILTAIVWPAMSEIIQINKETSALLRNMEIRYENAKNIRANLSKTNEVREEINSLNKYIFVSGDELKLVTLFESIAEKYGITQKIDSSNLDDVKAKYLSLNISAEGNYKDIFSYVEALEASDYFINITSFTLSPQAAPGQKDSNQTVILRFSINLYASQPT